MAFRFDNFDQSIVIDGFEDGIADSPYAGISDMRNVNIISVPGEADVNFATVSVTPPVVTTGTITAVDSGTDIITYSGGTNLESHMAIVFAGSTPTGITAGTVYWINKITSNSFNVYSDLQRNMLVNITSTTTGATFTAYTMAKPMNFAYNEISETYFMVDVSGQVWTNAETSTSGYWVFTGNIGGSGLTGGRGLVIYVGSDNKQWLFNFRYSAIDYTLCSTGDITNSSWLYGWKPSDGTTGNAPGYLKTSTATNNSHRAIVGPDNKVYYCDKNWIGRFYQSAPGTPFDPTNTSTYTFDTTSVLPFNDIAQCLAPLGNTLLIGGKKNVVYPWDTVGQLPSYPIFVAESNVVDLQTVNTNTFIFVGNRGRIYVTNGSQAQLYKKIPDHISGTIEPYYTWGGTMATKNQLYFSVNVTNNSSVANTQYGGVWAIDLETKAIRLTNKLSYGTYAGYATAMIPITPPLINPIPPLGTGFFIGWDNGLNGYGLDTSSRFPYTNSESTVDSDLIPIGTYNKPRDLTQVEYRLSRPLVSGESVTIKTRLIFNTSDTGYTTTLSDNVAGHYSYSAPINFQQAQWCQFQIVLNSTNSSPSYVRLREIRILGLVGPSASNSQALSI